jgi:hypothetical protein
VNIDAADLVRFIHNSQLSEDMKERLIPIAQVARPKDRVRIYKRVEEYNREIISIRKGTKPLTVDDIIFIRGLVEQFQEAKKEAVAQTHDADYLLDSHG